MSEIPSGTATSQPKRVLPLRVVMPMPTKIESIKAIPGHIPGPPQPAVEHFLFSHVMWAKSIERIIYSSNRLC